jgi:uncharacterized protein YwgA
LTDTKDVSLPERLNRIVVLLILLYSPGSSGQINEPVSGRTRLQKQTFLVQEDLRKEGVKSLYSFRPYKLGPLSYEIYNDLDWLEFEGILKEEKQTLTDGKQFSKFTLTQKGIAEVDRYLTDPVWKSVLQRTTAVKKATNSVNLSYLVESVHEAHPEYVLTTPVVRLLESLAASTGQSPTKTTVGFSPRKHKTKTSTAEEVRALRSHSEPP